jgi:hypothetical protein
MICVMGRMVEVLEMPLKALMLEQPVANGQGGLVSLLKRVLQWKV